MWILGVIAVLLIFGRVGNAPGRPYFGQHGHVCTKCGYTWYHGNWNNGSKVAHTCIGCGNLELKRLEL